MLKFDTSDRIISFWKRLSKLNKYPKMKTEKFEYLGHGRWITFENINKNVILSYLSIANVKDARIYASNASGTGIWFSNGHIHHHSQRRHMKNIEELLKT